MLLISGWIWESDQTANQQVYYSIASTLIVYFMQRHVGVRSIGAETS